MHESPTSSSLLLGCSAADGRHTVSYADMTIRLGARIVPTCVAARRCCESVEAFGRSSRQRRRDSVVSGREAFENFSRGLGAEIQT
jgi:hypothetical protein